MLYWYDCVPVDPTDFYLQHNENITEYTASCSPVDTDSYIGY